MSVVFLGTSEFAAGVLERLAGSDARRPALVLTRPDRPSGRGRRSSPPPVAVRARELGLPLAQPERVNDPQARAMIAAAAPDAGARQTVVVCAFGALIREPLLSEHELVNVHPSLLPRWRGAAPIERALMAGDERTGVSIMRLTEGLDDGPVCLVESEPIAAEDDFGSLADRLQPLAGELLLRALDERPPYHPQDERGVSYAEKITAEDRLLDPARSAAELERTVRALHPHIGARLALADGSLLGVGRARVLDAGSPAEGGGAAGEPPSGLLVDEGRLVLRCGSGALELLVVKPPGGRAMDAAAYLRGHAQPGRR